MERIMVRFTTKALEEQLKAARKELRAATRKEHFKAFFSGLLFLSHNYRLSNHSYLQIQNCDLHVYRIEKTLNARKKAIRAYQKYKKGELTRNQAQFAYLQYCYFKDKLTNHR